MFSMLLFHLVDFFSAIALLISPYVINAFLVGFSVAFLCFVDYFILLQWFDYAWFTSSTVLWKNVSWHRWPPEILGFPMVFFIYYMFILMSSLVFMVVLDVSWCFQCCYFIWLISSVLLLYWFHHMSSMFFWLDFRWLSCALLITSYYFNGLVMLDLLLQRFFEKCKLA